MFTAAIKSLKKPTSSIMNVMGLIIEQPRHTRKKVMLISTWVISIITLVSAPLTFVSAVRSPSHAMAARFMSKTKKHSNATVVADTKQKLSKSITTIPIPTITDCSSGGAMHTGLSNAQSSQLRKLAQYEQVCQSSIISTVSFFVPTPTTVIEAQDYASDVTAQLQEFARNKISPLVFFEPTNENGLIDLTSYRTGAYDTALDSYFAAIKAAGVSDAMMGTWVPIPEGNIPVWTSINPTDFAGSVTKAATFQKKYFPTSKVSIMLDNESYPRADSWDNGRAVSFVPYLKNIPAGLIDSFGLQGFPWSPPKSDPEPTNGNASNYLRSDLAVEAAKILNVQEVWLNTGTFGVRYANDPSNKVTVTADKRLEQLNQEIAVAKTIKQQGFNTSIHLFAENKSNTDEAVDWSYWPSGNITKTPTIDTFKIFVHNAQTNGIPLWLFDTI